MKEFPAPEKNLDKERNVYYYAYATTLDLSSILKDKIDLIRITWNIHVHESVAEIVKIDSSNMYNEVKGTDHSKVTKSEMTLFHNSKDLSDVTILCGTEVIPAHRCILAMASPVFRRMFETEMKEKKDGKIIIGDIDSKILKFLIKWIYTGNIEVIELQDTQDLFKATHKYQVETLKNWCLAKIFANISANNAFKMYAFGALYEETKIMRKSFEIMKANKDKVFSGGDSKEFIKRYPELVMELLKF